MKIGALRTLIEDKSDNELVFIAWYDKDEANEHIMNNVDDEQNEITYEEWVEIYSSMVDDEGIWQTVNEAFVYYVEKVIENRKKGKADDDSK